MVVRKVLKFVRHHAIRYVFVGVKLNSSQNAAQRECTNGPSGRTKWSFECTNGHYRLAAMFGCGHTVWLFFSYNWPHTVALAHTDNGR